ncbi:hypothetical protein [Herbihabitans rhizosphaerae]|uniref:hypothetical protein n=1 Tax=Herbihabitans rhizosphaerae TaxID=1872711 RepID=UPI00102B437E|nr:hypothetical protein [Herbihabitans rhizosphaerae]
MDHGSDRPRWGHIVVTALVLMLAVACGGGESTDEGGIPYEDLGETTPAGIRLNEMLQREEIVPLRDVIGGDWDSVYVKYYQHGWFTISTVEEDIGASIEIAKNTVFKTLLVLFRNGKPQRAINVHVGMGPGRYGRNVVIDNKTDHSSTRLLLVDPPP